MPPPLVQKASVWRYRQRQVLHGLRRGHLNRVQLGARRRVREAEEQPRVWVNDLRGLRHEDVDDEVRHEQLHEAAHGHTFETNCPAHVYFFIFFLKKLFVQNNFLVFEKDDFVSHHSDSSSSRSWHVWQLKTNRVNCFKKGSQQNSNYFRICITTFSRIEGIFIMVVKSKNVFHWSCSSSVCHILDSELMKWWLDGLQRSNKYVSSEIEFSKYKVLQNVHVIILFQWSNDSKWEKCRKNCLYEIDLKPLNVE